MTTSGDERAILAHLGRVAHELGPMLAPPGHAAHLQALTDTAMGFFGAQACSIALTDEAAGELEFVAASGKGDVVGQRVALGEGIAGWVAASGQTVAVDDVGADPRFASHVAQATGYVPAAILATPLADEHEAYGVISLLDPRPLDHGRDFELLELLARQATLAVAGSRAFQGMGRALLAAAARADAPVDVAEELERAAHEAGERDATLLEMAAQISELVRLGPAEVRVAAAMVRDLLAYARGR